MRPQLCKNKCQNVSNALVLISNQSPRLILWRIFCLFSQSCCYNIKLYTNIFRFVTIKEHVNLRELNHFWNIWKHASAWKDNISNNINLTFQYNLTYVYCRKTCSSPFKSWSYPIVLSELQHQQNNRGKQKAISALQSNMMKHCQNYFGNIPLWPWVEWIQFFGVILGESSMHFSYLWQ